MARRFLLPATLLAAVLAGSLPAAAEEALTYCDLVMRLMDPAAAAVLPAEGETCKQWSSWDRASRYDEATGKYVNWAANDDGPQFIRQEGDAIVIAEMEGPGCIWRIWSALAEKGHVKVYLDGNAEPAVDLPFINYFTGDTAPFAYPLLSYSLSEQGSRGHNLYLPIPYQKSCKIVAEKGWGRYYHVVYTTYPKGTKVPTFSTQLAAENAGALAKVNGFFAEKMGTLPTACEGAETVQDSVRLAPGEKQSLEIAGPRAIVAIRGHIQLGDREDQMAAMRRVVLSITWDGQDKPAVWCPLGDFFGTAPGVNLYKGLLAGITDEGAYAYWYMPFAKQARLELTNEDTVAREVEFEVVHAPLGRPFEGLGYFHCKWHRDTFPVSEDRWPDWSLLRTEGRGRFLGVMLHVWNPRGGWWGEGDEKFFVDGEKFPSTIGTGSEDYFGYAWCCPTLFQRPYHGQTMTENNQGHQSVFRWQLVDNVPFQKSFDGYIEKYYKTEEMGTQYACTVCWYLGPGGVDPYEPVPVAERHGYYTNPPIVAGGFNVLGHPRGQVQTQNLAHYSTGKWKNDDHLWWTGARPGDKLEVAVPVKKAGKYKVSVALTKARDYGIVQLSLDGKKAGEPIDLYNPEVVPSGPIALGEFELTEGEHVLGVQIVGANQKADPAYMFGLDYVVFESE